MTGVILSGGKNRRMGENKAFLAINGERLIDRTVRLFRSIFKEVIIVTTDPTDYLDQPAVIVTDILPDKGALGGIYTGLFFAREQHVFVSACDMPFLSLPLLRYMVSLAAGCDVVVPAVGDWLEPLHAIYGKACLGPIERMLEAGERKIVRFFPEVRVRVVQEAEIDRLDPQRLSFLNVNTPEDWDTIRAISSTSSSFPR